MKPFYCLLLMLCPYFIWAQPPVLTSISPGDKVNDIAFNNILNHKSTTARLSDFKGKIILLDFWATWCGNCIKKFNLLDSMQRANPDKLQVILINTANTRDTKERIERFLNRQRNAAGQRFSMPVVYDDAVAGNRFPHETIPHYVWLSSNLEFMAATGAEPVTAANIQKLFSGQKVNFDEEKTDIKFDLTKPFFTVAADRTPVQFRSTLTGLAPGFAPGSRFTKDKISSRFSFINTSLRELLKAAYSLSYEKDRLLLEVSDSMLQKLSPAPSGQYCYEFIAPPMRLEQMQPYMQQDMKRYLGLAIKKEIRPAECYVLNADSSLLCRYKTSGGKSVNKLFDRDKRTMVNKPLATLAAYLDRILDLKVILQTTVSFNLDIELPDTPAGDIEALKAVLAKMGILLTASTQLTEQFIIYQTPKQKLP